MEKRKVFFFIAGPTRADEDFTPKNLDNSRKQALLFGKKKSWREKNFLFLHSVWFFLISGYGKPGEIENLTAKKEKEKWEKTVFRMFPKNFISSLSTDDKCAFAEKKQERSEKERVQARASLPWTIPSYILVFTPPVFRSFKFFFGKWNYVLSIPSYLLWYPRRRRCPRSRCLPKKRCYCCCCWCCCCCCCSYCCCCCSYCCCCCSYCCCCCSYFGCCYF